MPGFAWARPWWLWSWLAVARRRAGRRSGGLAPRRSCPGGSFFGGRPGIFGTRTAPVAVTLPGRVAEVGSSNAAQYALLADGSLYA